MRQLSSDKLCLISKHGTENKLFLLKNFALFMKPEINICKNTFYHFLEEEAAKLNENSEM